MVTIIILSIAGWLVVNQISKVEEVRGLVARYGPDLSALTAIGYRQIILHLNEKMTLDRAVERIKFDTHAYARRQMTWFRRDKRIRWIHNSEEAEPLAVEFLSK